MTRQRRLTELDEELARLQQERNRIEPLVMHVIIGASMNGSNRPFVHSMHPSLALANEELRSLNRSDAKRRYSMDYLKLSNFGWERLTSPPFLEEDKDE